jgi:hypothetical protein
MHGRHFANAAMSSSDATDIRSFNVGAMPCVEAHVQRHPYGSFVQRETLVKLKNFVPNVFRRRDRPAGAATPTGPTARLPEGLAAAGTRPNTAPPRQGLQMPPAVNLNWDDLWNVPHLTEADRTRPPPAPPAPVVVAVPSVTATTSTTPQVTIPTDAQPTPLTVMPVAGKPAPTVSVEPEPVAGGSAPLATDAVPNVPTITVSPPQDTTTTNPLPGQLPPVQAALPAESMADLPVELLQQVMGHLALDAMTPGVTEEQILDRQRARTGAESLTYTNRKTVHALQPMLNLLRANSVTPRLMRAFMGTAQAPGPVTFMHPAQQEIVLPAMLHRADSVDDWTLRDRMTMTEAVRDHIATLPEASQAAILQEAMRNPGWVMNPRFAVLLGNTLPGAAAVPGTVLALPPALQVGPLRTAVDFVFGAATPVDTLGPDTRRHIAEVVNRLPRGVGEDLKTRVANP